MAKLELNDIDSFRAKAGFTIAEIETPQAAKSFVVSEGGDAFPIRFKRATPLHQRARVVSAESRFVVHPQALPGRRRAGAPAAGRARREGSMPPGKIYC